jgi:hypothetical protein
MSQLSAQLEHIASRLQASKVEVQAVLEAHSRLAANADADLRGNYSDYQRAIDGCASRQQDIGTLLGEVAGTTSAYVAGWEADLVRIEDPALRRHSEERMEEVQENVDEIQSKVAAAKEAFVPLLRTLGDHVVFLSNDLTVDAAATLAKDRDDLGDQAKALYKALDEGAEAARACARTLSINA